MAAHQGRVERWRGKWRLYLPKVGYLYNHRGVPFSSPENAQAVLDAFRVRAYQEGLERAAEEFKPAKRADHTVARWVERFLEDYRRRAERGDRSLNYLEALERYARLDWSPLAHRSILELESSHILELERALEDRGLGQNTVNKSLAAFHRVLTFADERLPQHLRFRLPRFPRREHLEYKPVVPTVEARDRVIAAIPEGRRGIFLAMCLTLRPSEARALDVADYDQAERVLLVEFTMQGADHNAPRRRTKEKNWRLVRVDDSLAEWISRHVPAALGPRALFQLHGRRWTAQSLSNEWRRACVTMGYKGMRLYASTKHATLSHAVRAGFTLYQAQALAGHKDPRTTQLYAKLQPVDPAVVLRARARKR